MQEGRPRELQGTSAGAIPLGSQPRSRQVSQPDQASGNFSWKHSALHKKHNIHNNREEAATKPWDSRAAIKDKETDVEMAGASSSNSSAGSTRKSPQSPMSDWTLDRLYPLDDDDEEDIGKLDVTQRRYDG